MVGMSSVWARPVSPAGLLVGGVHLRSLAAALAEKVEATPYDYHIIERGSGGPSTVIFGAGSRVRLRVRESLVEALDRRDATAETAFLPKPGEAGGRDSGSDSSLPSDRGWPPGDSPFRPAQVGRSR